ncbi:MAG: tRNA (adenosine(37)-N6)-threonylcarbamoyltransferase complex ATPase subunit type 1 TsaE [Deltaproteobacteria bacterium]
MKFTKRGHKLNMGISNSRAEARGIGGGGQRAVCALQTRTAEQSALVGEIIGALLNAGDVIALSGGLGAGKTVIVKGIARGLGIEDEPNSPTFVIMSGYDGGRLPLYHFDLYRLAGVEEMDAIGYEDFFYGEGVAAVEWAERAVEAFPPHTIAISVEIPEDGAADLREIKIEGDRNWVSLFRNTAEQALPTLIR